MTAESFDGLTLARVLRPWGRRGEVAAEILTSFPERLPKLRGVFLYDGRNPARPAAVRSCRLHLGQAIFHFAGVDSINDAERLRGLEVQVPLAERVHLGPGRFYISDLVGCSVWEADKAGFASLLGTVREVQQSGETAGAAARETVQQAWLLIAEAGGGEILIPLAAEICTEIDVAARRIQVRLPEGLRDLNLPSKSSQPGPSQPQELSARPSSSQKKAPGRKPSDLV